jgi:uncharacterized protein (TIGR00725 family)
MSAEALKYATLFGGSGNNRASKEYIETVEIGNFLAGNHYIIKNGGYGGMMEAVSKGASQNGGQVLGVTCKEVGSEKGNAYLTETIVTEKLYQRLEILIENTCLFIVQRGGIGTLSEVFLTLDIIRKMKPEQRPKIYFIGNVWENVLDQLKIDLLPKHEHDLLQVVSNVAALKAAILSF